ncbi:MAG TPA: MogA/MoaB family molybdenum cofactor biosynthesis protein [Acidobacteriota bacterium]|nr:MogA/MoaB family molybdenum cofactor biosynthesis protein [Acidobacteriota bacterium]
MSDSRSQRYQARVITVSSRAAAGEMQDASGPFLAQLLADIGLDVTGTDVIPDQRLAIQKTVIRHTDFAPVSLLALTGGTGPTPDDLTPEALAPLLDRRYDGLGVAIHEDARQKVPRAPLSRTIVGARARTVILALPGSPGGVRDALASLTPVLPHLLALTSGLSDPH